ADLARELEEVKASAARMQGEVQAARTAAQMVNAMREGRASIVTFGWNAGSMAPIGRDGVRLNDAGELVRHGERRRESGSLRYVNGLLADQSFVINFSGTTPVKYVEGNIKGGKADGAWLWYNRQGRLTHRETFANGKLVSVESATTARDGKVTYKRLTTQQARDFFNARAAVFAAIPELDRSL
ncbi:MAG: hypothetical protein MUE97_01580, partial [Phycisphaerales bacterium]|nr:hypothetical protein [Phycisphaerales bacterium]